MYGHDELQRRRKCVALNRRTVKRITRGVALFILFVFAYCLSYGPALSLWVRGYISTETLDAIYTFHGLAAPERVGMLWLYVDPKLAEDFRRRMEQ